ncbi:GNAT family protein [Roseovarius sp. EGI FJ00037]|nr:GNAT family protein [Roseovarius sp. EGI FJ00037]MCZ0813129.1 GNAT family protein [Roseovarius sp. EGI FJ00037]
MSDRPVGPPVKEWQTPPRPGPERIEGRYALLERLSPEHAAPLFSSFSGHDWVWDYMPVGPFASPETFQEWLSAAASRDDPMFYAIRDGDSGAWTGFASFLRIDPAAGSIEVGFIAMSPALQRTRAATEAIYLMMQWAFDAGYRRFEWKCDALNAPSRRAARRFGFVFEGVFRQATIVKGRNRDTAWFAVIDRDWPLLRTAYEIWFDPGNFDAGGEQI